ncbi:MAG: primosomal protein N' [Clostridia bacterium]
MIAKVLINTTVKSLNKVYDYEVPLKLEEEVEMGKRVEVSFGRSKNQEGIIVKIVPNTTSELKYKLKPIIALLDEHSYIDEQKLRLAKYMSKIYFCNVYDALKLMLPPGTSSKKSSKNLNTRQDSALHLVKSVFEIQQDIQNNVITSPLHIRLLYFVIENDFVLVNDVVEGLNISRSVINTVIKNGYIQIYKVKPSNDFLTSLNIKRSEAKIPTNEQKIAIDKIGSYIYDEKYRQCLLFGVTGSGKTEVYLQILDKVLMQGKRAIILVPEISLTYQTLNRFVSRFGNNVAILHSKMTISKRKEEYKKIKEGKVDIVIGARSAIFCPIDNLGIVIIDEEHDSSYYSQTTPKYSTKEVASYICKQNEALLLLATATPEVITYYKAQNNLIDLLTLKERPGNATLPTIEIVDMKNERLLGNKGNLSTKLKNEILINIQNGEQTMLFLNKRGYSSYFTCNDCSYIFKCPNCDIAMTYHKNNNLLLCHYCSHVEKNILECPICHGINISQSSIGTQKLEEELKNIYPQISILRMDADTTVARNAHQEILDKFRNENINVLIGTQMIAKGHDIANVTLVGVLGVDALLGMNEYLASEKAFSNISQVAGRAGRGDLKGRVLIQACDVDNYILDAVVNNSYLSFYDKEIEHRRMFAYPPFIDIILIEIISKDFELAKNEANKLYEILNLDTQTIYKVYSPKSPFIQKINNKYRVNILIKTKISNEFYSLIYEKLNIFNKQKKSGVSLSITRNPMFIG